MNPLPLTIISGYLGAGKTSLVNNMLRRANGRRLVVLVNDFGELAIDVDLIESQEGNTLNLANGCACCSMGGNLFNALVTVLDQTPRADHLIIEASGVADPVRLANIAQAEPDLTLDSIVSLVDAETLEGLKNDPLVGATVSHQLASSDIIVLNKLDLIGADEYSNLSGILDSIAPGVPRINTEYARVPNDVLIGLGGANNVNSVTRLPAGGHGELYSKWSFAVEELLRRERLESALDNLRLHTLRLKGIVYFVDCDVPQVVQSVGARWSITPSVITTEKGVRQSRLVAIGLAGKMDHVLLDKVFNDTVESSM